MIISIVLGIICLAAIFGVIATITGEENKGNTILVGCMTAFFFYMLIIGMFGTDAANNSVFTKGLPLIGDIDQYGSVKLLLTKAPGKFALDFVELVTLT